MNLQAPDGAPIQIRAAVKRYRDFQLGPVDLDVPRGMVTALIGPNGAGKTTLLRLIMGLARPTSGAVRVLGAEPRNEAARLRGRVGYVPEEPFLYEELTAEWHGRFASTWIPGWNAARYRSLLERFGVPARRPVKELSKGNRVKAELALALTCDPELLVLDEPTSGLDPLVRGVVLEQMASAVEDERRAVVFSTHITEDVERIADQIVFVVEGKVRLTGDRDWLREHWQEMWVDHGVPSSNASHPGIPGVLKAEPVAAGAVRLVTADAPATLRSLGEEVTRAVRRRALRLDEVLGILVTQGVTDERR